MLLRKGLQNSYSGQNSVDFILMHSKIQQRVRFASIHSHTNPYTHSFHSFSSYRNIYKQNANLSNSLASYFWFYSEGEHSDPNYCSITRFQSKNDSLLGLFQSTICQLALLPDCLYSGFRSNFEQCHEASRHRVSDIGHFMADFQGAVSEIKVPKKIAYSH